MKPALGLTLAAFLFVSCSKPGPGAPCSKKGDCRGDLFCVMQSCVDDKEYCQIKQPSWCADRKCVLKGATCRRISSGKAAPPPKGSVPSVGQKLDVELTLIISDAHGLVCAMPKAVAGLHCAYETKSALAGPAADVPTPTTLQPVTTVDRKQLLVAGLWQQPALKTKLENENPNRPSPRFTAACSVEIRGRANTAWVQWKRGKTWFAANDWQVVSVESCTLK